MGKVSQSSQALQQQIGGWVACCCALLYNLRFDIVEEGSNGE